VKGGLLLDVIVRQRATILQLLACADRKRDDAGDIIVAIRPACIT
jgi:hypothetical protein